MPRVHLTPCRRIALQRKIQSGAHGTVYVGAPVDGSRHVAVKVARSDASHVRRLAKEAMMLAQLPAHNHIVATFPTRFPATQDRRTGAVYLPMELYSTDLLEVVLSKSLSEADVLRYGLQLTCALHHCHRSGVYHLDIKPENVLVDTKSDSLKLADFGMALHLSESESKRLIGQHGSPSYAAPEVWDVHGGMQPATGVSAAAADVWSLGAVLFTLVFRRRCWSDVRRTDKDFAHYASTGKFLMYAGEQGKASEPVLALLYSMLAINPAERPSLLQVAAALSTRLAAIVPAGQSTAKAQECSLHSVAPVVLPPPVPSSPSSPMSIGSVSPTSSDVSMVA